MYTYIRTRIPTRSISTRNTNWTWWTFISSWSCGSLFSWWALKNENNNAAKHTLYQYQLQTVEAHKSNIQQKRLVEKLQVKCDSCLNSEETGSCTEVSGFQSNMKMIQTAGPGRPGIPRSPLWPGRPTMPLCPVVPDGPGGPSGPWSQDHHIVCRKYSFNTEEIHF